jgi:transposase
MNVFDKNELRIYDILMENASIRKAVTLREIIKNKGYRYVYLPPYSPLNPIEEFWLKAKCGVKRRPFDGSGNLAS